MKTIKLLAMSILAIGLASCSKETADPINVLPTDGKIRVVADVNAPNSRAGATTEKFSHFGLMVTNSNSTTYSYHSYMAKEEGVWNGYKNKEQEPLSAPMLWQNSTTAVEVIAYSEFNSSATPTGRLSTTVSQDQSTADAVSLSDFLYAKSSVEPANPVTTNDIYYETASKSIVVKMNHALSKLRVNVKYGNELTQNGATPTISAVKIQDTKPAFDVALTDGSITPTGAVADIAMCSETTTDGYAAAYEAIIVPQAAKFAISLIVDGREFLYTHGSSYTFVNNKSYSINLIVGKDVTIISNIATGEWSSFEESRETE